MKFTTGDKVEVLSSEEGFSDAWATATIVAHAKGSWLVEYNKFVDGDGKSLREKVRALPNGPFPSSSNQHWQAMGAVQSLHTRVRVRRPAQCQAMPLGLLRAQVGTSPRRAVPCGERRPSSPLHCQLHVPRSPCLILPAALHR